ncbi:hypothetical protein [uncultured Sphingomonas sp.]|uniref:hypothetical protein n=1 Tax=uncultured Sphingomonas sp. TaxID=158754 RepID=UPI0035CBEB68
MTNTDRAPDDRNDADDRSDIEQVVQARSDAVDRGEGGPEPDPMTSTGDFTGSAGTGGEVKNQDRDAQ